MEDIGQIVQFQLLENAYERKIFFNKKLKNLLINLCSNHCFTIIVWKVNFANA